MSDREDEVDVGLSDEPKTFEKKKSRKKSKDPDAPENTGIIRIKEFDINSIPPHSVDDVGKGVKIVVIGKPGCFAPGTKILMFDGSCKNVEDVKVGDLVMGDDCTARTVGELYHDFDIMYKIEPKLGSSYVVNRLHDLVLFDTRTNLTVEMSVENFLKLKTRERQKFMVMRNPVTLECPDKISWPIPPYYYGKLYARLLDSFESIFITHIRTIEYEIKSLLEIDKLIGNNGITFQDLLSAAYSMGFDVKTREFMNILDKITRSSYTSRKEFIAGFLFSFYGTYSYKKRVELYYDPNVGFETALAKLFQSVGLAVLFNKNKGWASSGFAPRRTNLEILGDLTFCYPLNHKYESPITRDDCYTEQEIKKKSFRFKIKRFTYYMEGYYEPQDVSKSKFKITELENGEYFGFKLDGNRRFLLDNYEVVKNTGKSTIINDIVATKGHLVPVAQIFSGTEDSNHFYSSKFPPVCVYNKLDMDAIRNFVTRQKIAKKYLPNPWALQIIDDCTDNPHIFRDPLIQAYYKNGRHWNMVHILSLQYSMDIPPAIRTNIDYTFILRETNLKNRKNLHENYAGCIPNFNMFEQIMDAITQDYTALVINNRIQSNKFEDCVFYYKAKPDSIPPNWKFGHYSAWEFSNERNDTNFFDPIMG